MPLDRSIQINLHDYAWATDGVLEERYFPGDTIPVVTTCKRPRSYLKHTLLGLRQEGIPDPIISLDSKLVGPVGAFLNAVKVVHDNFPKHPALIIQDDCWVTADAWREVQHRDNHYPFVFSMFRMMSPEITKSLVDAAHSWNKDSLPYFNSRHITDEANRYNGGCLLYLTTGMIARLMAAKACVKQDDRLPQWLGRFCEDAVLTYWQTVTPLAFHFGEVSSIQGRPEGHLMPVNPLMKALVEELDKKFAEDDKCLV